jgi:hypothetical protein
MNSEFRISNSELTHRARPVPSFAEVVPHQGAFLSQPSVFIRHSSFVIRICSLLLLFFLAQPARACSVCFGGTDSQLSRGMLAGVLVLLLVVLSVLGGFVALFVYLARRAAAIAALENQSSESKA